MSRVALALIVLSAAPAAAEGPYTAWPRWAPEVGFGGHVSQIGARSEGGVDGVLALSLGLGRWQLFGSATLGTAGGKTPDAQHSRAWFGGGVRWLARQYAPEPDFLIEMDLHAQTGIERYAFGDGSRLVRPDVAVGLGMDIRSPGLHQLTTRLDVRIVFTPTNDGALVACRGTCDQRAESVPGLDMGVTFAW